MIVYLLTIGDGEDGNEWSVISIHSTMDLALEAKSKCSHKTNDIEEWSVDPKDEAS